MLLLFDIITSIINFLQDSSSGDVSYNSRRGILSAIPVAGKVAYHIFNIEYSRQKKTNYNVKLLKKAKWHLQHTFVIVIKN